MEKVRVNLKENSYNILIGKGLLGDLENLAEHSPEQNFIITDKYKCLYGII